MNSISFGNFNSGFAVGVNQGSIYLSQERPEPRPKPLSTVPFPRDPEFVARDALLENIHKKASIPGSRTVLVGLGGVGKTQLAIEYCHRIRQQSNEIWVFWIHASNVARCENSLRDLADRAKIPGRQERNAPIFQIVGDWLQDEKLGKWILVLDNVDDDELLHKPLATTTEREVPGSSKVLTKPPLRYLLGSLTGSIIITSRNKKVALDIASKGNIIDIQSMEKAEALDLLQKKLHVPGEHEEMEQLVETLEYMPLAIVQAAAYITHRALRFSVSQYLEKIQKSDREAVRLLNYEAGLLDRDWEANNSILLTWQISFDYIQAIRPSAAGLLSLMSFFDRLGIPENILKVQQSQGISSNWGAEKIQDSSSEEEDGDHTSGSDADQQLEDDIILLTDYSLILIGGQSTVLTMHRLVQLTVRIWLEKHGQFESWKEIFISNLYRGFPVDDEWGKCQSLFPHIRSALFHRPKSRESLKQRATLLYRGAWYAWQSGNIAEAKHMASKSRQERLRILGEEHNETLEGSTMLAIVYQVEGRWREAEQLFIQVTEKSKINFGEGHPNTLLSMSNLAAATEKSKTIPGEDYPDTLSSITNLAATYWNQGRWKEAELLQTQVIEKSRIHFNEDHPKLLSKIHDLALIYCDQGRWEKAEQLFIQVMETRNIKLSKYHPSILRSMYNLALIYIYQCVFREAEQLNEEVIETSKTKLGTDHPETLIIMSNLAWIYHRQGRWEEAKQLNMEVMETRKTKLRMDHPDTLIGVGNLALIYHRQGRLEEAEQLQAQVMEKSKTKVGEEHPRTLLSMASLAFTWRSLGRNTDAIILLKTCVAKQQQTIGPAHPDTLSGCNQLLEWEKTELVIDVFSIET